ncbi:hypothetical protein V5F77_09410 [Xanthobacter sp. DSM 24535]|uniref:hypothetical protein n=1 Tax=Roseixanthobacter psychrophilus TaxID=3119917 RepID=UPI00372B3228
MKKLVLALVALAVLGIGGYFGFSYWSAATARAEVEKVFAALRQSGAQASYAATGFDLPSRTLTISDIAITSAEGSGTVRIAHMTARGITPPSGGRFTADLLRFDGVEAGLKTDTEEASYIAPLLEITRYSGPTDVILPPGGKLQENLRATLQHFAEVSAERLTVPQMTARVRVAAIPASTQAQGSEAQTTVEEYGPFHAEGIGQGRIARIRLERMTLKSELTGHTPPLGFSATLEGIEATALDTAPLRALSQPGAAAIAPGYQPLYGRIAAASYSLSQDGGATIMASNLAADAIAIDPSLLNLSRIDALNALSAPGHALTPDESVRLFALTSDVLKSVSFASISVTDTSVSDATGKVDIGRLAMTGYSSGKLQTLQVDKFAGTGANSQPLTFGSASLNGLSLTAMMDLSAKAVTEGAGASADSILALFHILDGVAVTDLAVPQEGSAGTISVGSFALNWGQFIGAAPTRFTLKASDIKGPISDEDSPPFSFLAAAGMTSATLNFQMDLAYDEASRAIVLGPASADVAQAFSTTLDARLTDVPRSAFEDATSALSALNQIGLGPVKLMIVDHGLAELALKQYADLANVGVEEMRGELVAAVEEQAKALSAEFPNAERVGAALVQFLKAPKTLTLTLSPRDNVKLMDLVLAGDPIDIARLLSLDAVAGP